MEGQVWWFERLSLITARSSRAWLFLNGVRNEGRLALYRAWQTQQNGFVESFNGSLSDECLNETLLSTLKQARHHITLWKEDCNVMGHKCNRWTRCGLDDSFGI